MKAKKKNDPINCLFEHLFYLLFGIYFGFIFSDLAFLVQQELLILKGKHN